VPALLMARHHPSGGQSRSRDPRCRARGRMPSRRRWRYMTARARRPTLPTARPPRYPGGRAGQAGRVGRVLGEGCPVGQVARRRASSLRCSLA
jgi:hypothetical protein